MKATIRDLINLSKDSYGDKNIGTTLEVDGKAVDLGSVFYNRGRRILEIQTND